MDPVVAYMTAFDTDAAMDERRTAARNLLTWIYGGGFLPFAAMPTDMTKEQLITKLIGIRDAGMVSRFVPVQMPEGHSG